MEGLTLTQKEQTRLKVLNSVLVDQVPVCQAAEVLGVSERHTRRILRAYKKEGAVLSPMAIVDACQSMPPMRRRQLPWWSWPAPGTLERTIRILRSC